MNKNFFILHIYKKFLFLNGFEYQFWIQH